METAGGKTVSGSREREALADFEAQLLAEWQEKALQCREARRLIRQARWERRLKRRIKKGLRRLQTLMGAPKSETSESGSSESMPEKGLAGSSNVSERKCKFSEVDTNSVVFSSICEEEEGEEVFEAPTLSFEEYLTYEQPQKEKQQATKPSLMASVEDQWHSPWLLCRRPTPKSSTHQRPRPRPKRTPEKRAAQEPPEAPQPKRMLLHFDIKLPDIPLPPMQASCSPLPAVEDMTCSQKRRRAVASPAEEGFIGRRVYSKTLQNCHKGRKPQKPLKAKSVQDYQKKLSRTEVCREDLGL